MLGDAAGFGLVAGRLAIRWGKSSPWLMRLCCKQAHGPSCPGKAEATRVDLQSGRFSRFARDAVRKVMQRQ